MSQQTMKIACAAAAVMSTLTVTGSAATVAWWRFEEPDTRPTEVYFSPGPNTPVLNATLDANVEAVVLSSQVAASYVTDGVGGAASANTQSLHGLVNVQAGFHNQLNNGAATPLLNNTFVTNAAAWTFETFVYLPTGMPNVYKYGEMFGNGSGGGDGFTLDLGASGNTPRFFSDVNANAGVGYVVSGSALSSDTWHHLALTATPDGEGTWTVTMYEDYALAGSTPGYHLNTYSGYYGIAAPNNAFAGYVDEMRISDVALTPAQMLHLSNVVPEPSSLMALAGVLIFLQSRRRNP